MTTGFQFGTGSTSGGLFGAKTTSSFTFGTQISTPATSSFSFGATASSAGGSSLFGPKSATTTSATTAFSFAKPASSAGGFTGFGKTTTTTLSFTGFGKTTTASTGLSLGVFGKSTASTGFGIGTTGLGATSLSSTATSSAAAASKPVANPKEENVPKELSTLVSELETYVKKQKEIKEEITKTSSQEMNKLREEIASLGQAVALISNRLQRDFVAVQNLKSEVGQEVKNAEIAQRLKDMSFGSHHDLSLPMEYFQRLVYSYETRITSYRSEIEELETFLSSSSDNDYLTPQNLIDVLRHLNDSFIGLASQLQNVHEVVKIIKAKYLQYRRFVCNDPTNPFTTRKPPQDKKARIESIGPSPFPVVQGAGIIMNAIKPESKAPSLTGFSSQTGFGTSFGKPALTRSLSAGGKSTGFGSTPAPGSGSLFGKSTAFGNSTGLSGSVGNTSSFTLQKPPSGKRGKLF